ncbi:MAG: methyltransferase domain-containing protein, partial [Chloroflexota bacterium]
KKLVQQQFSKNPEGYATSLTHGRGASLGRIVELTAPQPTDRALDVATAAGHTALALAPHVRAVVGLDLTVAMFVPAARLARERSVANIAWLAGDVEAMPVANAAFEIVVCRISLHHWPNAPQGIAEMARVTKRGGRVVLVDNVVPDDPALAHFVNHYETVRDPSHQWCYTLAELTSMFALTGLRVQSTETLDKPTAFDDWLKRMSVPAPTVADLQRMLDTPEAAATIHPESINGLLHFHLTEAIIAAVKA